MSSPKLGQLLLVEEGHLGEAAVYTPDMDVHVVYWLCSLCPYTTLTNSLLHAISIPWTMTFLSVP
jgi:hypothetical protein